MQLTKNGDRTWYGCRPSYAKGVLPTKGIECSEWVGLKQFERFKNRG
ncbi:hypothetical protein ACFQZR_22085 [Paenibacillus sp. GCM10027629]